MADRDAVRTAPFQGIARASAPWRIPMLALPLVAAALLAWTHAHAAPPKAGMQIGAIVPESWPDAARGEEIRNGMLLALKTWPGQPAPTLVIKDSACDPKKAAAAAQSMLDAKVDMVLGGWCVVGSVPQMLRGAGVPFVSSNSERFTGSETTLQFASVPAQMADTLAARLRAETGLRVTGGSRCWIDYDDKVPEKYDAALCPTLNVDSTRWAEVAPTYTAAYRKPFTVSAARGYAAMQVALAYIKQVRAGVKPAQALRDAQSVDTMIGKMPALNAAPPEDAMRLVFAAKLPKLSARESAALNQVVTTKSCGCVSAGSCAKDGPWASMPFVVHDPKSPQCSAVKLATQR
jgi:ABC-type branched-subunit amino acid transport system substrate-binding protein